MFIFKDRVSRTALGFKDSVSKGMVVFRDRGQCFKESVSFKDKVSSTMLVFKDTGFLSQCFQGSVSLQGHWVSITVLQGKCHFQGNSFTAKLTRARTILA